MLGATAIWRINGDGEHLIKIANQFRWNPIAPAATPGRIHGEARDQEQHRRHRRQFRDPRPLHFGVGAFEPPPEVTHGKRVKRNGAVHPGGEGRAVLLI